MKNEDILKLENGEALLLKKKLDSLKKRKEKLDKDWVKLIVALELVCIHNEEHTFEKYEEGTYYDPGIYHTITECTVCGKTLNHTQKTGGYA